MLRGICSLSVIPVRTEPSDKSEQCTQLLFGEVYTGLTETEDKKWLSIETAFDHYTGWISVIQHFPVSESYYLAHVEQQHPICSELGNFAVHHDQKFMLLPGSTLPFYNNKAFVIGQLEYNLEGSKRMPDARINWKQVAELFIRSPYTWGGRTPFGIDCSGFTQQVFKICGIHLLRDAYQQATQGKSIDKLGEARPGDLAFFDNDKGRIVHVGIILENSKIIHASGEVRIDRLDSQGIWNTSRNIYTHKLRVVQRIMDN